MASSIARALVTACLGVLLTPIAVAHADSLHIRAPKKVALATIFVVKVSGSAQQPSSLWVYFSYGRCARTAHEEAIRGYPSFHRQVGPGNFRARSRRIARRADQGYYCAYLYGLPANAKRKPNARAARHIAFFAPDLPPQGRRPVGKNADGRQQLYLIGSDGRLYTKYQLRVNASRWSPWVSLGGSWPGSAAIGLGRNKDGRQQIYVIGRDYKLHTRHQKHANKNAWSPWTSLGAPIGGYLPTEDSIGVGTNADGRQQIYLVGANSQLYTLHQKKASGRRPRRWLSLGGRWPSVDSIGVGSYADGRQAVYLIGTSPNYHMYTNYQTQVNSDRWFAGGGRPWVLLGGDWYNEDAVVVGADPDGRQAIFAVGTDTQLYVQDQEKVDGGWTRGWTPIGRPRTAAFSQFNAIGIGRNRDGRQQVGLVGNDTQFYTQFQKVDGDWSLRWNTLGQPHGGYFPNAASVGVGRNKDGREELYLVGSDGKLYTTSQVLPNSSSWEPSWTSLGGSWPAQ